MSIAKIAPSPYSAKGRGLSQNLVAVCKALAANKLPGKGYRFCRHLNRFVKQPILRKNRVSNIIILNALAQLWK